MPGRMRLRVPRTHHSGLAAILSLTDEQLRVLADAITKITPISSEDEFASKLTEMSSIPGRKIRQITEVLIGLEATRTEAGLTLSAFLDAVNEAIRDAQSDELRSLSARWDELRNKLDVLLSADKSLGVVSKSLRLYLGQSNVFHDARIVTDIRPVFHDDASSTPVAAMIVHNLRLRFHRFDGDQELIVGLDSSDIERLREVLKRAEQKEQTLRTLLESTSIAIVGTGDL